MYFKMFVIFILTLFASSVQAKETFVFSTFPSTPLVTICETVLRTAYQKMEIEIKILNLPGERAIRTSNQGETDGELYRNINVSQSYINLQIIPIPIASVDVVVFSKIKFPVKGWESLRPYSIGVERGFKLLETNTQGMKVNTINTIKKTFQFLVLDGVDVVVQSRIEGLYEIKNLGIKGIHVLEPPIAIEPVYHHLHKKHTALIPKVTRILLKMEKDGELLKIKNEVIKNYLNMNNIR